MFPQPPGPRAAVGGFVRSGGETAAAARILVSRLQSPDGFWCQPGAVIGRPDIPGTFLFLQRKSECAAEANAATVNDVWQCRCGIWQVGVQRIAGGSYVRR